MTLQVRFKILVIIHKYYTNKYTMAEKTDGLRDRQMNLQMDRQVDRETFIRVGGLSEIQAAVQFELQMERMFDRQTDTHRQRDRRRERPWTDRQTIGWTYRGNRQIDGQTENMQISEWTDTIINL